MHIPIDDATRLAYVEVLADEKATAGWLDFYNRRRPHPALSHKPPHARLNERNNLLGSYT